MKKYIAYAVAAFFATVAISSAATTEETLLEKEKAAWQAFKDKKPDDFKKVVSAKLMAVYAEGVSDMQGELAAMQKWDMKSFEISDFDMFSDEKDVIVTTYKVKVEGTVDGKDASGTYNAGSVWKLENGKWLAIFHTNIKAEEATPDAQKKE